MVDGHRETSSRRPSFNNCWFFNGPAVRQLKPARSSSPRWVLVVHDPIIGLPKATAASSVNEDTKWIQWRKSYKLTGHRGASVSTHTHTRIIINISWYKLVIIRKLKYMSSVRLKGEEFGRDLHPCRRSIMYHMDARPRIYIERERAYTCLSTAYVQDAFCIYLIKNGHVLRTHVLSILTPRSLFDLLLGSFLIHPWDRTTALPHLQPARSASTNMRCRWHFVLSFHRIVWPSS